MPDAAAALLRWVRAQGRPEGVAWLEAELAGAGDLAVALPAVSRQIGRGPLDAGGATLTGADGETVELAAWRVDDAARALLLLGRRASLGDAVRLYHQGDARERTGVLRALSLLPGAGADAAALPAILDAMRVNQGEIFEAAILDSPYASRHLPVHEWRKAVLKAVFVGLPLARVVRIDERADAELAQSLLDFALEREAAGRAVPPTIWPVAALHAPPGLAAKLLGYLEHPDAAQRAAAAAGLGRLIARGERRVASFLHERGARERDPAVIAAIRGAIPL